MRSQKDKLFRQMYPNVKGPYRNRHGKWVCYYRSKPEIPLPLASASSNAASGCWDLLGPRPSIIPAMWGRRRFQCGER
jgi:hypothetical protein